ncbi:hypothetical protein FB451DRAFT_1230244 [Mycena latifolia]|nr:hypothetical protein FB451DRAFT_1230244 [Mycena latifolia]
MAITTLESQRRNSVVLLETLPRKPPPPPYHQIPTAVRPIRESKPRPIHPRWESAQTIRRRRIQAAERAVLDAHAGRLASGLFTHTSLFGTRTLPPPGSRAYHLDANDYRTFMIGDRVRVRRFKFTDEKRSHWTEWQWGQVMFHIPMRSFAGNFGAAYVVRVISQLSGQETLRNYIQFMGEICAEDGPDSEHVPCASVEVCMKVRIRANCIYTRVDWPGKIGNVPHKDAWIPAEVLTWEDGQDVCVQPLVGPAAGKQVFVKDAIPYTIDTAVACRKQGQSVVGPDGKLFLQDLPIKSLASLPVTKSIFNFPSPEEMVANLQNGRADKLLHGHNRREGSI